MAGSTIKNFPAGEVIIHEDEISRKMFILKQGSVQVYKTHMGKKITLATLGAGEVFGELSFFDSQPRSASVETLTPCEVVVVEGAKLDEELNNVPKWVWGIFKSVFVRFRTMDKQLSQLQNLTDFAERVQRQDLTAQLIYFELHRFNTALRLTYGDLPKENSSLVEVSLLEKSFEDLMGKEKISSKVYFKLLQEHSILKKMDKLGTKYYELVLDELSEFDQYLVKGIKQDHYFILTLNSISLLRAIIGEISSDSVEEMNFNDLAISKLHNYESLIAELLDKKVMAKKDDKIIFLPKLIDQHFVSQSIIKSFDHSLNGA